MFNIKTNLLNGIQSFEFGDRIYLSGSDRVKEIINKTETLIEESESRLKDSIKELSLDFFGKEGYPYILKNDNPYGLPRGIICF